MKAKAGADTTLIQRLKIQLESRTVPILLADWSWSCCVDLTDAQAIGQYIEHKLNDR
ncbi:MAG: hypothetical protein K2H45_05565 [Acetatifactor sp.]|nr:hypothetical protein [Acetatifactor sp.]